MNKLVIKFGGTSVRYGAQQIVKIIQSQIKNYDKIIIVVSALADVTNLFHEAIERAKNKEDFSEIVDLITSIHKEFHTMINNSTYNNFFIIENYILIVNNLLTLIKYNINNYNTKIHAKIISFGELISMYCVSNLIINYVLSN